MASFSEWPRSIAKTAGIFVSGVGLLVLVGWGLNISILESILAAWPAMVPATALCFALAGMSLFRVAGNSASVCGASQGGAILIAVIGLLRISYYIAGKNTGWDYFWFHAPMVAGTPAGSMSPATAFDFVLLGGALLLAPRTRFYNLFQIIAMVGCVVGWLGFSRYFYGGQPLAPVAKMAAHTSLSFLILSIGILCIRNDRGLVGLLVSDSAGGTIARRLLPPAMMIPFVFGWLRLNVQNRGWLGPEAALTVFSLINVAILGGLVWATAGLLDRIDKKRKQAEEKTRSQLERLALLHQITRAIGDRQDLKSIFQVVVLNVKDKLPLDFCCLCTYNPLENELIVGGIGARSREIAKELGITEESRIPIDRNGLSRCVQGQLVYEPDIGHAAFPFTQQLARGGMRSLVLSPLLLESQVFGVLISARRAPESFSSGECEFLRQLSEHVALASHQAQLYDALKHAYNDLRQSQQAVMQQERLRALGQMASGIAHDINNAISPVSLYTESLLENEPNLSERARNYLITIQRSIEDVAATVARMKEFYRQREPQLVLTPVHVDQLLQQVADLTRARWSDMPQQRGVVITLKMETEPGLPAILGIASEIREALTNLIFNAVDAMPEGGTLTLRARLPEDEAGSTIGNGASMPHHVIVEVSDTGAGMDEETRRHCLEPFFTTKGERGTGLGLAMVYGVLQRHNAEVKIESAPGAGTTMRIDFPVPAVSPSPESPVLPETAWTVPPRLRILTIDDDPVVIQSIRHTLEGDGHLITAASDGGEGINTFTDALERNEPFDVVITDLGMPYVDGRQVASAVKKLSPTTPVILLTGWGQRLAAEGDIPPFVDQLLSKPPKLRELRQALAACFQPAVET